MSKQLIIGIILVLVVVILVVYFKLKNIYDFANYKTIIIAVVILLLLGIGGRSLYGLSQYKRIISEVVIETPDISRIQDGTYNGSFDAIFVFADVDVNVKGHEITGIKINEHRNGRGARAEVITDDVILKQSVEVDTVSGATSSSRVILKAIENALESGIK